MYARRQQLPVQAWWFRLAAFMPQMNLLIVSELDILHRMNELYMMLTALNTKPAVGMATTALLVRINS